MRPTARLILLLLPVLTLLSACGGGLPDPQSIDSQEEVAEATVQTMQRLAEVLEDVKTPDDAQAAIDDIRDITRTIEGIMDRVATLPEPSPEEMKALNDTYEPKLLELKDRIRSESERISGDESMRDILADAMWDLSFSTIRFERPTSAGARPGAMPPPGSGGTSLPPTRTDPRGDAATPGRDTDPGLAHLIRVHGKEKVATVIVNNPPPGGPGRLIGDLQRAIGAGQVMPLHGRDQALYTFYLAPVEDLRAMANKISIGRVDRIDDASRTITIEYEQ